jgi:hypothetical protein
MACEDDLKTPTTQLPTKIRVARRTFATPIIPQTAATMDLLMHQLMQLPKKNRLPMPQLPTKIRVARRTLATPIIPQTAATMHFSMHQLKQLLKKNRLPRPQTMDLLIHQMENLLATHSVMKRAAFSVA